MPVEEQEKFRAILQEGIFDVTGSEEGPMLDLVPAGAQSGKGEIDVIGALHGTFPPLARENALMNVIHVADDLMADRDLAPAFLETGLLGTDDFLNYVPWMQATYIMAANVDALAFLPGGADVNALTWEQFGQWRQNLLDETGELKCGLPQAGLFHRFLEGYMWPSFTGGMVTNFKSADAAAMLAWARDSLWPTIHPESINYEFMQEPLLAGEVWVAFDHIQSDNGRSAARALLPANRCLGQPNGLAHGRGPQTSRHLAAGLHPAACHRRRRPAGYLAQSPCVARR